MCRNSNNIYNRKKLFEKLNRSFSMPLSVFPKEFRSFKENMEYCFECLMSIHISKFILILMNDKKKKVPIIS